MKKDIKLRNVIFPIWMLWMLPPVWLVVIPANIIIDYLVLNGTLEYLKVENKKQVLYGVLAKTVIFGFLADIIASIPPILLNIVFSPEYDTDLGKWWQKNIDPMNYMPYKSIIAVIILLICVILGGFLIYYFNKKFIYKDMDLTECEKYILARNMALITAPYLFLAPTAWFVK